MITVLIGGVAVGVGFGFLVMGVGWVLENTRAGVRVDRFIQRLVEAGL